jgi:hypothetical protein
MQLAACRRQRPARVTGAGAEISGLGRRTNDVPRVAAA